MPRNVSGVFSKPAGTTPVLADTLDPALYNLLMDDFTADANLPRPIVAGGTGASTAAGALTALGITAPAAQLNAAGDASGPASSVDNDVAFFNGTTGKLLKRGQKVSNGQLADMPTARIKGRVTAATGPVEDLTVAQVQAMLGIPANLTKVQAENPASTVFGAVSGQRMGEMVAALLGREKTFQTVTRTAGTNYQNTNLYPLDVLTRVFATSAGTVDFHLGPTTGSMTILTTVGLNGTGLRGSASFTVPVGWYYKWTVNSGGGTIELWSERSA